MEKKRTQRIIGMLVVIALVVIITPLFFGKNDTPAVVQQATTTKAPPAPVTDVAANTTDADKVPDQLKVSENSNLTIVPESSDNAAIFAPAAAPEAQDVNADIQTTVDGNDTAIQLKPAVNTEESNSAQPTLVPTVVKTDVVKDVAKDAAKAIKTASTKSSGKWVIQMGCFKSKQNALNLANKLRKAGYKTFTRDSGHSTTLVYIGPEAKQAAVTLSQAVQKNLNLQGIVVSYKTLES
jgi:DedD protein